MANEYTPEMKMIRADYIALHTRNFDAYMVGRSLTSEQEFYGDRFDDALAAHDRAVKAEVWDQAVAWHAEHVQQIKAWRATGGHYTPDHEDEYNPYRADEKETNDE